MKISKQNSILLAGLVMAGASVSAFAQTSTTAPMGSSQPPAAVGVSPQTATDANRAAVPRSDTGTVVRTGPNAVDSARSAASSAAGSMSNMGTGSTSGMGSGSTTGSGSGSSSSMGSGSSSDSSTGTTMRAPKADRN